MARIENAVLFGVAGADGNEKKQRALELLLTRAFIKVGPKGLGIRSLMVWTHGWNSEPIDEPGSYTNAYAPRVLRFLQSRL